MPSIDGIVSGFDTTGLINAITGTMAVPIERMKDQLGALEKQKEAVSELSNLLGGLADAAEGLDEAQEAWAWTPTSSNEEAVSIRALDDVVPGTWNIEVEQLAQAEVSVSEGYEDKDEAGAIGLGFMRLTVGEERHTLWVTPLNDSLQGLADAIDEIDGVSAYVMNDGGKDPFRLVVRSDETGENGALKFDTKGIKPKSRRPKFTETVSAQNARIELDGMRIESSSNTFKDAVPGIEITVHEVTVGSETIQVSRDDDALADKMTALIEAYNTVHTHYKTQSVKNVELDLVGGLAGDSTSRRVMSRLGRMITSNYGSGELTTLAQLGVSTQRDGSLELDNDKLRQMISDDPHAVRALLTDPEGPLTAVATQIRDVFVDDEQGMLRSRTDSLESAHETLTERIERRQDQLASTVSLLRTRFERMESAMAAMQNTSMMLLGMLAPSSSAPL